MKSIISFLILFSFQINSQEIYMPDLKSAANSIHPKQTLPEFLRSPKSDIEHDCPAEEYDLPRSLNFGSENLISKVVTGSLHYRDWCDGQEGSYQFNDAHTGGFISNTAEVDPTAIIGPLASVCDSAKVKGLVKICGRVEIRGDVILKGNFKIYGKGKISPR